MYRCNICEEIFDEPKVVKYKLCEVDQQEYGHDHVCPFCGSYEISEVEPCEGCGEYYSDEEMKHTEDDYLLCPSCSKKHRPYRGINSDFDAVGKMLEAL